jgi:hypothetical protein
MSKPSNPLHKYRAYEAKHVLLAFDNVESAAAFQVGSEGVGKCGDELKGLTCGKGYVVVNELKDDSYSFRDLVWAFDFFSPTTPSTTIAAGEFTILDARGNQFPSFLRRVSKKLKLQESRIVFYLLTVFRGRDNDNKISENYVVKPLIFSLTDSSTGYKQGMANQFTFNFVFHYNTLAQLPNYSRLDQFTITNSENNPSRSIPTTEIAKAQILPRAKEDAQNKAKRNQRLSHSRPMRSLGDLFKGFDTDLKELRYENRRQLQEFMAVIRPTNVKKIKLPKAKRVKDGQGLPLTYVVNIDDAYKQHPIDNRNLMTEQTETRQVSSGITSYTTPPGASVFGVIDSMMSMSSKVGDDVKKGYGFKTVMTVVTDCEKVTTNTVHVQRYRIPKNEQGKTDTGPDKDGNVQTLELSYMEDNKSLDVISIHFASSPSTDIALLEEDSDDVNNDPVFASSQREQLTFERPDNTGFSGLRIATNPANFGLEKASSATLAETLKHRFTLAQNTMTIVTISGNPDLYSDLARNPVKVARKDADEAKLYKFPEFYPMYVKLKIRIANSGAYGVNPTKEDEDYWYHTYHYHLSGVTNTIVGGKFVQTLRLLSTDDAI